MRVLVVYDVTDARLRRRLARVLSGFGERVQRSAFECLLTGPERARLEGRLRRLVPAEAGAGAGADPTLPSCSVRLYVVAGKATELGQGHTVRDDALVVV